MNNTATVDLKGEKVAIEQVTEYPWSGKVVLNLNPGKPGKFNLLVRIPGWAQNQALPTDLYRFRTADQAKATISLNGKKTAFQIKDGYAVITKEWKKGDQLVLNLPMPVREITANPAIKEDTGKMALQRGPLVYCFEWPDNKAVNILTLNLENKNKYTTEFQPDLLNGVTVIKTTGSSQVQSDNKKNGDKKLSITAIPYYSWANRGPGAMNVWMKVQK